MISIPKTQRHKNLVDQDPRLFFKTQSAPQIINLKYIKAKLGIHRGSIFRNSIGKFDPIGNSKGKILKSAAAWFWTHYIDSFWDSGQRLQFEDYRKTLKALSYPERTKFAATIFIICVNGYMSLSYLKLLSNCYVNGQILFILTNFINIEVRASQSLTKTRKYFSRSG